MIATILRNSIILLKVTGFSFLSVFIFATCSEHTADEVEAEIAKFPLLQAANKVCLETPVPEGFVLISKQSGSNSENALIAFYYRGDLNADSILSFYYDYFARIGWKQTSFGKGQYSSSFKTVRFENDGDSVEIENMNSEYAKLAISCAVRRRN